MDKIPATRVTNVLKLVHGWQNDGYQKIPFFGIGENCECPAGYGQPETRLHFVKYTAPMLKNGHNKHQIKCKTAHAKMQTTKVIYDAIMSILSSLHHGTKTPKLITHFDSEIDRMVNEAWEE